MLNATSSSSSSATSCTLRHMRTKWFLHLHPLQIVSPCRTVSFCLLQVTLSSLLLRKWTSSSCSSPASATVVLKFGLVRTLFRLTCNSPTGLCCYSPIPDFFLGSSATLDTWLFCSLICRLICSFCLPISSDFVSVKSCVSWSLSFNFLSLNPTTNLSRTWSRHFCTCSEW